MSASFPIQPIGRFAGEAQPVKRPKEFACFSYDDSHEFHLGEASMRWYYPPRLGADLNVGFGAFIKHDDSKDEHLDSLLRTIADHEQKEGKMIDAKIVTWRGMMTKIMATPFEDRDGFEMNATLHRGCIFIEENHQYKQAQRQQQEGRNRRGDIMSYWGYKFETLATLPRPWGETSREYIEHREGEIVNNNAQYCSVVRTGIGKTVVCLGGEVDAIWDSKPVKPGAPIHWVELKTSAELRNDRDREFFDRKLMKFWIQSFLLGVPRIIVGMRDQNGILRSIEELQTDQIPDTVARGPRPSWNGNMCVNFAAEFLDWLVKTIDDDGVWRIRRRPGESKIDVFRIEEAGHGEVLTDDFINWRIKLSLGPPPEEKDA